MFGSLAARVTEESQRDLAHCVESRQESRQCQDNKHQQVSAPKRLCKNRILGPETRRQHREAGQSQTTDQEGPECNWHLLPQAAHIEHVLCIHVLAAVQHSVFHPVNYRARIQE